MATNLEEFIARAMEQNPIEKKILHKIHKALKEAGDPIVSVYDGDEATRLATTRRKELDMLVFNLDECFLTTKSGGWVRFVMGNEWDCISDYTLRLEEVLKPVNDYVEKYSD